MARIGYRRVSTIDQNLDRQDLGFCDETFEEKISGKDTNRPALADLIRFARKGDEVVVYSIDRLARDLRDLQAIIETLTNKGASITFLTENLTFKADSDDPFARLQLHLMGAFAQFERSIIKKRQAEGIAKAKARGVYKGGKKQISRDRVHQLKAEGLSTYKIAEAMGISRMSVHRILNTEH